MSKRVRKNQCGERLIVANGGRTSAAFSAHPGPFDRFITIPRTSDLGKHLSPIRHSRAHVKPRLCRKNRSETSSPTTNASTQIIYINQNLRYKDSDGKNLRFLRRHPLTDRCPTPSPGSRLPEIHQVSRTAPLVAASIWIGSDPLVLWLFGFAFFSCVLDGMMGTGLDKER